jgi:hypothetical protein
MLKQKGKQAKVPKNPKSAKRTKAATVAPPTLAPSPPPSKPPSSAPSTAQPVVSTSVGEFDVQELDVQELIEEKKLQLAVRSELNGAMDSILGNRNSFNSDPSSSRYRTRNDPPTLGAGRH